jgi:2'-5' RNA ligase
VSDEKIRLFVALELPPAVREALVEWRLEAVRGLDGLRLIRPEDLHVTLCFLGWQPGDQLAAISAATATASAAAAERPLDLTVGPPVWLPPRRPRVLAVDLADAEGWLASLQAALSEGLAAGGWYRPEQRPFRAHVTVARVARGARIRAGELPAAPELRFGPGQLTLFRSQLSRAGAHYEAVARVAVGVAGSGGLLEVER